VKRDFLRGVVCICRNAPLEAADHLSGKRTNESKGTVRLAGAKPHAEYLPDALAPLLLAEVTFTITITTSGMCYGAGVGVRKDAFVGVGTVSLLVRPAQKLRLLLLIMGSLSRAVGLQ
jgi:hypothetical protein